MKRYKGGEQVKEGSYWDIRTWEFVSITGKGGVLPGGPEKRFIAAPRSLVILAGPLIGLGYVMFMPVVGPMLVFMLLARKMQGYLQRIVRPVLESALPSWAPGVSYLFRRNGAGTGATDQNVKREGGEKQALKRLERRIAERRKEGEK